MRSCFRGTVPLALGSHALATWMENTSFDGRKNFSEMWNFSVASRVEEALNAFYPLALCTKRMGRQRIVPSHLGLANLLSELGFSQADEFFKVGTIVECGRRLSQPRTKEGLISKQSKTAILELGGRIRDAHSLFPYSFSVWWPPSPPNPPLWQICRESSVRSVSSTQPHKYPA
jgi:hypothetical protein